MRSPYRVNAWESYLRRAAEGAFNDSFRTELLMFRLLRSPCHLRSPHALHKDPLQLERAQCMERIFLLQTLLMCSLIIELTPCVWLCVNLWISPMTTSVLAEWLQCVYSCLLAYIQAVHVSVKWIGFGSEQLCEFQTALRSLVDFFVYAHLSLSLVGSVCISE